MTQEMELLIIGSILTLAGGAGGSLITYFLDSSRTKKELLLQSKKEVYGKIISAMSGLYFCEKDDLAAALADPLFKVKRKVRMGRLFGQGRLLANKDLSAKLREMYDCESQLLDNPASPALDSIAKLGQEIEALMKREIGA